MTLLGTYDFRFAQLYGWEQLEAPILAAKARYKPDFIASDLPEVANIVAFALDDKDVTSLTWKENQFDFWFDKAAHAGQNALIVLDATEPIDYLATQFRAITPIGGTDVARFGYSIRGFKFYFAEGYAPNG